MLRFVVLSVVVIAVQGQYRQDSRTAAIISEQRYLSGDGKFGAAYTQEDGIDFKEETDPDGTRRGRYSYVDPEGQTRVVSYTAGKNGFQAHGDHLPQAPPAPAHAVEQLNNQPQYPQQPRNYDIGNAADYDDGSYDERYNDPSFNGRSGDFRQSQPAAAPAPVAPQYQQQQQPQQVQPSYVATHHQEQYNPQGNQYTTQQPHRFQPPGKLQLSRTADGFSYTFNKV